MQVWDYNSDGSITFNILPHDFDKDGNIIGKDYQYAPPYYPISYKKLEEELNKNGFKVQKRYNFNLFGLWGTKETQKIDEIKSEEEFNVIDWYFLLAKKEALNHGNTAGRKTSYICGPLDVIPLNLT